MRDVSGHSRRASVGMKLPNPRLPVRSTGALAPRLSVRIPRFLLAEDVPVVCTCRSGATSCMTHKHARPSLARYLASLVTVCCIVGFHRPRPKGGKARPRRKLSAYIPNGCDSVRRGRQRLKQQHQDKTQPTAARA